MCDKERVFIVLYVIEDTVIDTLKLLPFLFLTYLAMEYLEHHAGEKLQAWMGKAGWGGPVAGGLLGMVPQCGFAAAASNLYAGGIISLGTLLSVFLSASDEMLPILVSERAPIKLIGELLLLKAVIGVTAGIIIDTVFSRNRERAHGAIHRFCEQEHCRCAEGIWKSALSHTVRISLFIFAITFALNLSIHFMGENVLAGLILDRPALGAVVAGLVGLIPNCAGSVVVTQMYLEGAIGLGAAMAGLLTSTGVGLLVLFRVGHDRKDALRVLGMLYLIGVFSGIVIGFF